jgi:hypothetical protein
MLKIELYRPRVYMKASVHHLRTRKNASSGERLSGLSGSGEALSGSGEALSGSGEALSGSGEALSGSGEVLSGSGEALSGSGEALSGSGEALSGSGEALSGFAHGRGACIAQRSVAAHTLFMHRD